MKVNKVDHICIAVKNLDESRAAWETLPGKEKPDVVYVDEGEKGVIETSCIRRRQSL